MPVPLRGLEVGVALELYKQHRSSAGERGLRAVIERDSARQCNEVPRGTLDIMISPVVIATCTMPNSDLKSDSPAPIRSVVDERRVVTALFADVMGSTELGETTDP